MKRTKSKVIGKKECQCGVDEKQPSLLSKIVEKLKGTFKKKAK